MNSTMRGLASEDACPTESKEYDLIFQGRIGSRVILANSLSVKSTTKPDESYENVGFYETKIWKGEFRPQGPYNAIPIRTGVKDSYKFPKSDDTYLVYATKMTDGTYFVHRCSPTKLMSEAREESGALGNPVYVEKNPYYIYSDLGSVLNRYRSKSGGKASEKYWWSYVEQYRASNYSRIPCEKPGLSDVVFIGEVTSVWLKIYNEYRDRKPHVDFSRDPFYPLSMIEGVTFARVELYRDEGNRLQKQFDARAGVQPKRSARNSAKGDLPKWAGAYVRLRDLGENSYEFAEVGSRYYLVRGNWRKEGDLYVDRCSGTKPIEEVSANELKALGSAIFRAQKCYTCTKEKGAK
ncbi:MAG: hypothetical protein KDD43_02280 [Bdellovibrionales bacterium]|nr:hypothetical protein [Bdellovibrionales bacterium]